MAALEGLPLGADRLPFINIQAGFLCSLTGQIMVDPVLDPTNVRKVCERQALENYVRENGKSPHTGRPLTCDCIRSCDSLKDLIFQEYWCCFRAPGHPYPSHRTDAPSPPPAAPSRIPDSALSDELGVPLPCGARGRALSASPGDPPAPPPPGLVAPTAGAASRGSADPAAAPDTGPGRPTVAPPAPAQAGAGGSGAAVPAVVVTPPVVLASSQAGAAGSVSPASARAAANPAAAKGLSTADVGSSCARAPPAAALHDASATTPAARHEVASTPAGAESAAPPPPLIPTARSAGDAVAGQDGAGRWEPGPGPPLAVTAPTATSGEPVSARQGVDPPGVSVAEPDVRPGSGGAAPSGTARVGLPAHTSRGPGGSGPPAAAAGAAADITTGPQQRVAAATSHATTGPCATADPTAGAGGAASAPSGSAGGTARHQEAAAHATLSGAVRVEAETAAACAREPPHSASAPGGGGQGVGGPGGPPIPASAHPPTAGSAAGGVSGSAGVRPTGASASLNALGRRQGGWRLVDPQDGRPSLQQQKRALERPGGPLPGPGIAGAGATGPSATANQGRDSVPDDFDQPSGRTDMPLKREPENRAPAASGTVVGLAAAPSQPAADEPIDLTMEDSEELESPGLEPTSEVPVVSGTPVGANTRGTPAGADGLGRLPGPQQREELQQLMAPVARDVPAGEQQHRRQQQQQQQQSGGEQEEQGGRRLKRRRQDRGHERASGAPDQQWDKMVPGQGVAQDRSAAGQSGPEPSSGSGNDAADVPQGGQEEWGAGERAGDSAAHAPAAALGLTSEPSPAVATEARGPEPKRRCRLGPATCSHSDGSGAAGGSEAGPSRPQPEGRRRGRAALRGAAGAEHVVREPRSERGAGAVRDLQLGCKGGRVGPRPRSEFQEPAVDLQTGAAALPSSTEEMPPSRAGRAARGRPWRSLSRGLKGNAGRQGGESASDGAGAGAGAEAGARAAPPQPQHDPGSAAARRAERLEPEQRAPPADRQHPREQQSQPQLQQAQQPQDPAQQQQQQQAQQLQGGGQVQAGQQPGPQVAAHQPVSWDQLAAGLQQGAAGEGEGEGVAGLPGPAAVVVDLGGRTFSPAPASARSSTQTVPSLRIRTPARVRNGKLLLSRGGRVRVEAAGVVLEDVEIRGPGHLPQGGSAEAGQEPAGGSTEAGQLPAVASAEAGLVEVAGPGASATLLRCTVSMHKHEPHQQSRGRPWSVVDECSCVLVVGGASADLKNTRLLFAGRDGLVVCGNGSRGSAEDCEAEGCGGAGFTAMKGGQLTSLVGCKGIANRTFGICSEDPGSIVNVGAGCLAKGNETGLGAVDGGRLEAAAGTRSEDNTINGFMVKGEVRPGHPRLESVLVVGDDSEALRCGVGFAAYELGTLRAGARCKAAQCGPPQGAAPADDGRQEEEEEDNSRGYGFLARGQQAVLIIGEDCEAEGCKVGLAADEGGNMRIGDCPKALKCGMGYLASGPGARLEVGIDATAEGCLGDAAFLTEGGGVMVVDDGAAAEDNKGYGFLSCGPGSKMTIGQQAVAENNGRTGLLAIAGGSMKVGPSGWALGNGEEGFAALSGEMELGLGCGAQGNLWDGFVACMDSEAVGQDGAAPLPGKLTAPEGGLIARANGGCGLLCEDVGSLLDAGPRSLVEGNKGAAGCLVRKGGELRLQLGSRTKGNKGWGLCVRGPSVLRVAQDCVDAAQQGGANRRGAVAQQEGGQIVVSAGSGAAVPGHPAAGAGGPGAYPAAAAAAAAAGPGDPAAATAARQDAAIA